MSVSFSDTLVLSQIVSMIQVRNGTSAEQTIFKEL